jgi:hypothetical protein
MSRMMPSYYTAGHSYYDHAGQPIGLFEWADLTESSSKFIHVDGVVLPDSQAVALSTVYLGFVDPGIPDARLFGTALVDPVSRSVTQLDVWDTKQDATAGHTRHRAAISLGFHCHRCETNREHTWTM